MHEIWLVDLDLAGEPLRMLARRRPELRLLTEGGSGTAGGAASPDANRQLARAALRLVVASRLALKTGRPLAAPDLRVRADGKPHLAGDEIAFSLAHSGRLALIAIADLGPLGIDLELPRAVVIEEHRRAQIEVVAAALAGVPLPTDPAARLLVAWTRLEAVAKATGEGVGRLMTRLGMTWTSAHAHDLEPARQAARWIAASDLHVSDLTLGPGRFAATAHPTSLPPPRLLLEPNAVAELISATLAR